MNEKHRVESLEHSGQQPATVTERPGYHSPTLVQVGDLHSIQGGNGNRADSRNRLYNNLFPRV
jgi:hypothetical protein